LYHRVGSLNCIVKIINDSKVSHKTFRLKLYNRKPTCLRPQNFSRINVQIIYFFYDDFLGTLQIEVINEVIIRVPCPGRVDVWNPHQHLSIDIGVSNLRSDLLDLFLQDI